MQKDVVMAQIPRFRSVYIEYLDAFCKKKGLDDYLLDLHKPNKEVKCTRK